MDFKNELIKVITDWNTAKASNIFAVNFFMDYFPDKLKVETADAFTKAGGIVSVGEVVPENQLRGYPALIQAYHADLMSK